MAMTPEIHPPCLVDSTLDCHIPCLNINASRSVFDASVNYFHTTPEEQRKKASEEGALDINKKLLLTRLEPTGLWQRCIMVVAQNIKLD